MYERFERNTFGANNHYIRFDSGGTKTVALKKLRPQDWAVLTVPAEHAVEIAKKLKRLEEWKPGAAKQAAKQPERERDAEAAGTKVSLPASATACAASIFPIQREKHRKAQKLSKTLFSPANLRNLNHPPPSGSSRLSQGSFGETVFTQS